METRFIVLIDLSEYSPGLLRFAHSWSARCNASMLLVHQTHSMTPAMLEAADARSIEEITNANALERLQAFTRDTLANSAGIEFIVTEREITDVLRDLLKDPYNHLLLLGLKGTGTLKKIFIGSVAVDVINELDSITIAIPKGIDRYALTKVHVGVQLENKIDLNDLDRLLELMGPSVKHITFFSVNKAGEESHALINYLASLSERYNASEGRSSTYELYENDKVFDDIKQFMSTAGDEILVVQRGGRMFLDLVFRKFLINELIYDGKIPLAVLT